MARNTAQQGAAFERRVVHDLSGSPDGTHPGYGYDCVRSAASKGKIDIVAIGPERWTKWSDVGLEVSPIHLIFIQCKLTDPQIGPTARMDLMDLALRAGALAIVAHWAPDETSIHRRKKIHYRELTGPGPKDWRPWAPGEDD